jgi:hypothetical protein
VKSQACAPRAPSAGDVAAISGAACCAASCELVSAELVSAELVSVRTPTLLSEAAGLALWQRSKQVVAGRFRQRPNLEQVLDLHRGAQRCARVGLGQPTPRYAPLAEFVDVLP